MKKKGFYEALLTKARLLISDMERIGCAGFDLKAEGLVSENAAFDIAGSADCIIVLLRELVSACQHALDIVDRKAYSVPLSDYETKLICRMAESFDVEFE